MDNSTKVRTPHPNGKNSSAKNDLRNMKGILFNMDLQVDARWLLGVSFAVESFIADEKTPSPKKEKK